LQIAFERFTAHVQPDAAEALPDALMAPVRLGLPDPAVGCS